MVKEDVLLYKNTPNINNKLSSSDFDTDLEIIQIVISRKGKII